MATSRQHHEEVNHVGGGEDQKSRKIGYRSLTLLTLDSYNSITHSRDALVACRRSPRSDQTSVTPVPVQSKALQLARRKPGRIAELPGQGLEYQAVIQIPILDPPSPFWRLD